MQIQEVEIAKNKLIKANELSESGKFHEGLALLHKIVPVFQLYQVWEKCIETLNDIASIHYFLNQLTEATQYVNQAIEIGKTHSSTETLNMAKSYFLLAYMQVKQNHLKECINNHKKSIRIRRKLLGKLNIECAKSLIEMGFCYGKMGLHNQAIEVLIEAKNIYQKKTTASHYINTVYANLGWNYLQKGNYTKSKFFFAKALEVHCKSDIKTILTYNNLGLAHSKKGDITQALHYYQESLSIALYLNKQETTTPRIFWNLANTYHNIGFCYFRRGELEQAMKHYQKALKQWLDICEPNDPILAKSYDKHALCFEKQGEIEKAVAYYEQALNIRLEVFGEEHPDTARSYLHIGLLKPLKEQLGYFEKALQIREVLFGGKHPDIGTTYEQIGKWYVTHQQWEKALTAFHQGVCSLYQELTDDLADTLDVYNTGVRRQLEGKMSSSLKNVGEFLFHIPPFEKASDGAVLLQLLRAKSQCFQALYGQTQATSHLTAANAHIIAACDLIDYIRLGFKAEGSKLFLNKQTRKVYGEAIATLMDSQKALADGNPLEGFALNEAMFGIAEKSRAAVLLGNMKEFDAKIAADIPADLLEQEQQLQLELSYLDQQIQQANFKETEEETVQNWQSQYFQHKRKYDALTEQLEKDYPAYFQLKYSASTLDVATLQQSLPPQSALIEYFVDEERLYIFWVTTSNFEVVKVEGTAALAKTVRQCVRAINSGNRRRFAKAATQLSAWLIQPIASLLEGAAVEHLIFIPDDCLFMLPFDALLQSRNQRHLIEDFAISHHYSASLWHLIHHKRQQNQAQQADSFLGFAPIVFGEQSLKSGEDSPKPTSGYTLDSQSRRNVVLKSGDSLEDMAALEESEVEVQKVFQLFDNKQLEAKAFFYEAASKANLMAQVKGYKYILISTHGFVNKEAPSLSGLLLAKPPINTIVEEGDIGGKRDAENANKLFLSETYHLPLSADLVVLSSCESGIGEVLKGEGMIALNRGFLYAGASNVLYSLIKVPQDATSELVQTFFREILEGGKGYSEALQMAKRKLIAEGYELRDWAGFALLGGGNL